jgi:peptide deformylase
MVATFPIRQFGDPVLKERCADVVDIDGALVRLAEDMIETMYAAPGVGLAANQIGVQKRLFVYDVADETGPHVVINPVIQERGGEWLHQEGCLSVRELWWDVPRAMEVHLTGLDLDGNELSLEGTELLARVFQHETDHLDGVIILDRITADERKQAMGVLRERILELPGRS